MELTPVKLEMHNVDVLSADELEELTESTQQAIADLQKLEVFLRAAARLKEASQDKHGEKTPQPMMPKVHPRKAVTVEWHEAWHAYFALRDSLPPAFGYSADARR